MSGAAVVRREDASIVRRIGAALFRERLSAR
jgi:hypothetical protein